MEVNKSTHSEYKTELFMPILKEAEGKYIAVLSDNSVDRDEEKISKDCIEKLGKDNGYLAALCNHDNDVFMQVAEWINRGVHEVDGHTALIAEPRFFIKSSPQARQIKGMLDEGAKIGISIGAIVKDYDDVDDMRIYKELELVEASFVAIPSNRHGRAMAIAKSFSKKKNPEGLIMEKEFTQKDVDSAIEKSAKEIEVDFTKQLETKDVEIIKLKADIKKAEEEAEEASKNEDAAIEDAETAEAETKETEEKVAELEEKLTKAEKVALEKQQFVNEGSSEKTLDTEEKIDKSFADGKLPIMRGI